MQAVVERVMRAFTVKHPSGTKAEATRQDSVEFASKLLENYRTQLAQRERSSLTN